MPASVLAAAALALVGASVATPAAAPAVAATPAQLAFDSLLALEGSWTGTAEMGDGKPTPTTVTYRVTANRSVLVETLFGGTPHEMLTLYHLDGDDLVLTHYCAARNQPHMKARLPAKPGALEFEFVSATNLKPGGAHMHSARIVFESADKLHTEWMSWDGGKPGHVGVFELTRAK